MVAVKDLVEDWIAIRSTLSRQLSALRAMPDGNAVPEATRAATIARLEKWLGEVNALLKDFAGVRDA